MEKIKAAAIRLDTGEILTRPPPARHPSLILDAQAQAKSLSGSTQGFLTESGEFVDRKEAFKIAQRAQQFIRPGIEPPTLYTEDLW